MGLAELASRFAHIFAEYIIEVGGAGEATLCCGLTNRQVGGGYVRTSSGQ